MAVAKGYVALEDFLRLPEDEAPLEYEDRRVTRIDLDDVIPGFQVTVDQVFSALRAD